MSKLRDFLDSAFMDKENARPKMALIQYVSTTYNRLKAMAWSFPMDNRPNSVITAASLVPNPDTDTGKISMIVMMGMQKKMKVYEIERSMASTMTAASKAMMNQVTRPSRDALTSKVLFKV